MSFWLLGFILHKQFTKVLGPDNQGNAGPTEVQPTGEAEEGGNRFLGTLVIKTCKKWG